jgi:predicted RNase H-like HicB family nuclease
MEFLVVLTEEDGCVIAKAPMLPGCHATGLTRQDAMRNIREAIELYLSIEGLPASRFLGVERIQMRL